MYSSFARRLTTVVALALALCLLSTSALCETSMPSVFANDIAPNGYHFNSNGISRAISGPTSGLSVSAERHNALIADGWVLVSVEVKRVPVPVSDNIGPMSLLDEVVIEDTKAVTATYIQPLKNKSSYNSVLLDGITNLNGVVTTVVSSLIEDPRLSWVPSAVGFVTQAIVDASAKSISTLKLASTLYTYDIQVKKAGWPYYFTCATSEKIMYSGSISTAGYEPDGTPFNSYAHRDISTQSLHYMDTSWLVIKAIEYAKKNNDSCYSDFAPKVDVIKLL